MNRLGIPPNRPVTLSLVDPEGEYDFDLNCGRYRTTGGEELILPRPAVIALNGLEPKPGEEIGIQHHVSGRKGEAPTWTVWLTPRSEQARAGEEAQDDAQEPQERAPRVSPARGTPRNAPEPATPIRKPVKRQLGTGTDGPAPEPVPAPLLAPARPRPNVIPWNVAFREVSAWVSKELETNRLSDEKHICPLQLGLIRRCVYLWTLPGDVVLSPFAGIGSEGVVSIEEGRKFIGMELNESYFKHACRYIGDAETSKGAQMNLLEEERPE